MGSPLRAVGEIVELVEKALKSGRITYMRLARKKKTFLADEKYSKAYELVVNVEAWSRDGEKPTVTIEIKLYEVRYGGDANVLAGEIRWENGKYEIIDETNGAFAQVFALDEPQEMIKSALEALGLLNT